MRNALYRTSNLEDWIAIAKNIESTCKLSPVYWIANPKYEDFVESNFPNATFHSILDAIRNIPPCEYSTVEFKPLDSEVISRYDEYREISLKLMNRIDPGNSFNYNERLRHYHNLLRYWKYIIENLQIDVCIFTRPPHSVSDYVIYSICCEQNIDKIIIRRTSIPGLGYITKNIYSQKNGMAEAHKKNNIDRPIKISSAAETHVDKISKSEITQQSADSNRKVEFLKKLLDFPNYTYYTKKIFEECDKDQYKQFTKPIESSTIKWHRYLLNRGIAKGYKMHLKRKYNQLAEIPDWSNNYIYFPLHYQPELSTTPLGDKYSRLILCIEILSNNIPDNWMIYVKEHPALYTYQRYGERGRLKQDYIDMVSLPNVKFVEFGTNTYELIDHSEAVSTVTGTAGWEAVNRATPAIVFGNPWYRGCEGVYHVSNTLDVKNAIRDINCGVEIRKENILDFIHNIEDIGYYGYHSSNWESYDRISERENIKNTSKAISDALSG